MRQLVAALLLAAGPIMAFPIIQPTTAAYAATLSELGDLSAMSAIVDDTLAIARSGDMTKAEARITDFESVWDEAAGSMQPLSPSRWGAIDVAADKAIEGLRAPAPNSAGVEAALTALLSELDNPGGGTLAAAPPVGVAGASGFAMTNADGSPLPCEVALKTLRDAAGGRTPSDKAGYDTLMGKGLDRCNADDDKRADAFFADAFALLQ